MFLILFFFIDPVLLEIMVHELQSRMTSAEERIAYLESQLYSPYISNVNLNRWHTSKISMTYGILAPLKHLILIER